MRLLDDAPAELARLQRLWRSRGMKALKTALATYHERRKRLVPYIVVELAGTTNDRPD
jgi:hypothetical protein